MTSKRKRRRQGLAPSMFPFLAVLICTMGALIAVLVVGVQQARVDAAQDTQALQADYEQAQELNKQRKLEIENYQWRREVLESKRVDYQNEIQENRLKLAQLESHIRDLEGRWQTVLNQAKNLVQARTDSNESQVDLEDEIARLQQEIFAAKTELEQARVAAQKTQNSYAIIPYQGAQGTHRMPVYLECTAAGVVIQPEGILVSHADLDGPPGVGNPLNACLRTIREFYARHTEDEKRAPYPLLIVRSEGVLAFGKARLAMADWKDEYGYELVSNDLPLAFPNPQPALSGQLKKTIALAKDRQRALAQAMPSRFPNHQQPSLAEDSETTFNTNTQSGDGIGDGQQGSGNFGSQPAQPGEGGLGDKQSDVQRRNGQADFENGNGIGGPSGGDSLTPPPGGVGMAGRQQGWALDARRQGPAITRPVKVIVEANRLTLIPAVGERGKPIPVELDSQLAGSIDTFVDAVHGHIQQWGIAIAGGHWKPEIKAEVRPGGEKRFKELQYTLFGSGINVWRHTD